MAGGAPAARPASRVGGAASTEPSIRRALTGVYVAFIGWGVLFSSWAARIPAVRDRLALDPGRLGLLLLCLSAGSILGVPLAGPIVHRAGTRRAVTGMSLLATLGLAVVAVGYRSGPVPAGAGLFVLGLGVGTWDVGMNVEGAAVERRLGRSVMSRFHAGFSLGTVAGALLSAALIKARVPVTAHLLAVAALVAVAVPLGTRTFGRPAAAGSPVRPGSAPPAPPGGAAPRNPLRAWSEGRTLLIGVGVLAAAFSEGTGNDWLGIAVIDGYHVSTAAGSLSFAAFLGAMTVGRWFGPGLIDRWGRVAVLRGSAGCALAGLLLTVFAGAWPLALVGVAGWGLGSALGFPVGMSAAADEPAAAAGRVSVVASIGYLAFLAGPPLIGLLGNHVGTLRSLTAAGALVCLGGLTAGACRQPLPRR